MFITERMTTSALYYCEKEIQKYANKGTLHSWNIIHKLDHMDEDLYVLIMLIKVEDNKED